MAALQKMTIYAYKDETFSQQANPHTFVLQVNPASIKYRQEIELTGKGPLGGQFRAPKYSRHKEVKLNMETTFDSTGVLSPPIQSVTEEVKKLERTVYDLDGDMHRPHYLNLSWGSFIFNCVLEAIDYDYTLFSPDGKPLRVKIALSFTGYVDKKKAAQLENRHSPDMTHVVTLKAGESIARWCHEIYGDATYCMDVAQYNRLPGFRNIKPGTKIIFPPLLSS